jgi:hypothetical protein
MKRKKLLDIFSSFREEVRGGVFLLCLLLLVSCGTKKKVVSTSTVVSEGIGTTDSPLQHIVQNVNANRHEETFATAKMKLGLPSNNKSVSIGGMLRMKRNDVIQLSLVTFGILEVARIEMTPDYFMGIDKMGKQYVKAAWGDVSFFKSAGIDFYTLQALFWDELFVLGAGKSTPTEKQFKKSMDGERAKLTNADSRLAVLSFSVNIASGLIRQTTISSHAEGSSPYLTWDYMDFSSLGKKYFPTYHLLTISGSGKPITANILLSNLENDSDWETRTPTPGRNYTEVTVEKLMSRILSLTK